MSETFTAEARQDAAEAQRCDEYASLTLVLDHLRDPRPDGATLAKAVFSTESATEALVHQLEYFGMSRELSKQGVIKLLAQAQEKAAVFVLEVPPHGQHRGQVQIIVDAAIWTDEATHASINPEGTVLGFHAALYSLAIDLLRTMKQQAPGERLTAFITD